MTREPQLPQLPAGYFWRVTNRTYAIPHVVSPPMLVVQIRYRTWLWFSRCVDSMHSVLQHSTHTEEVEHCAQLLHQRFMKAQVQHPQAQRIVGDYK